MGAVNPCCADLGACTGCGTKDEPRSVDGRCGACCAAGVGPHAWCDGCAREAVMLRSPEPVLAYFGDEVDDDADWERYQDEGGWPAWI